MKIGEVKSCRLHNLTLQLNFESVMLSEGMRDVTSPTASSGPKELWELTAMETALVTAPTYPRKNLENGAGCVGNQRGQLFTLVLGSCGKRVLGCSMRVDGWCRTWEALRLQ